MRNKKLFSVAALSLLGIFGLTACNEIVAKPTDYEDKIVTFDGDKEVYNNIMSIVYDALKEGTLASDVLEDVLYEFSISILGRYNNVVDTTSGSEITLKDAVKSANGDRSAANTFIKAHKAYWSYNNNGERVNDNGEVVDANADASESEYSRLLAKWDTIEERIAEKMHAAISAGTYSDRNIFSEEKYLMNLNSSLSNVANPYVAAEVANGMYEGLITPDIEDVEVFNGTTPILHREYYQSNYGLTQTESKTDANTYVEDELIPEIYNELLVEQYLLDESYNTLGRSYARKVNVVSITANSEYPLAADYLMKEFVETYINREPNATTLEAATNQIGLDDFKVLSNAWKGAELDAVEKALLDAAGFTTKAFDGEDYYLATEYGDMMDDYSKITDNPLTTDASIESTFTNNNAYTKEVGKEIKEREILLKDHTENGWYIKNGGLSDLPETIRTRLFNIGVANALDNDETVDRFSYDNGWNYSHPEDESAYIATINGAHYLKVATTEVEDSTLDMLHYDAASKTYYIIQVEEAVSTSKLSKTSDNSYTHTRGTDVMEEIVAAVVKIVGKNDSYKTLSKEHWIEVADIVFHDETVRDYFVTNFPELFK